MPKRADQVQQSSPVDTARIELARIEFPAELPVSLRREEIARTIAAHQVVIICGETGSGKTTQLPKICLTLGRGRGAGGRGLIGHTQPRRLAASSTARRIAEELKSPLGEHVGFKVRFQDRLSSGASIKLMTDGILLAETQSDPLLQAYDTLIIDEAHERSLNIDFLLGYLREILPRRPDLKLIVTSATIDVPRFAAHFASAGASAPVIEVSGRTYPVEIRYRPFEAALAAKEVMDVLVDAVDELCAAGPGDVLVFLPGERQIRDAAAALRAHHPPHTEILPLFARLSAAEQERVFHGGSMRRIVLATNVAETSLTVPGIRYVVDTGQARVKRYSYRNKVEQLQIEAISRASARQRAGRCGRVAAGICIRLYEEADLAARPEFTDPEILRSSLAAVILRMKALRLGAIESFPFIEAPPARAIADGYQLLGELGAIDDNGDLTAIGSELTRLPLDPCVGRMILAGRDHDCLSEMLVIGSALSVQDPRERPLESQDAADKAHKRFAHERSEFLADLNLWNWFNQAIEHKKSQRDLRDQCRENFVSQTRLREWRDVHSQLLATVAEHGWRINQTPATYEQVHLALLTGLLGNIGCKSEEEAHYLGAHGIKFFAWPGTTLGKVPGRWVVAAELVNTTRLYARKLARIEPQWLERIGAHLLKRSWGDPHWEKKAGRVVALERATLYGLVVYSARRVDFARIDARQARVLFIRDGLVAGMRSGEYVARERAVANMLAHNRRLFAELEQLEHKARRQDVLVDDQLIEALCDAALPAEVCDVYAFEKWYTALKGAQARLLYLSREDLMRHQAHGVTTDLFPKTLAMSGVVMEISYHFEPGAQRDGATLQVPLFALNQVDEARADWLVSGMLKEKVSLLLKSLPQKLRRHCVPLPEYAEQFCARHETIPARDLVSSLCADLRAQLSLDVRASDFRSESLPQHFWMNFKVVDEHGRQLGMSRNLATLRAELGESAQRQFQQAFASARAARGLAEGLTVREKAAQAPLIARRALADARVVSSSWQFGELPELMEVERDGQTLVGYPALSEAREGVSLEVFEDPDEAARVHRVGLRRLFMLQIKETIRALEKGLPGIQQMALQFMSLGSMEELRDQIVALALERSCMAEPLPRNAEQFAERLAQGKPRVVLLANEIARLTGQILTEYAEAHKKLASIKSHALAHGDIQAQLARLVRRRFVIETAYERMVHLPRYLKAVTARIDKLRSDAARDARLMSEMAPLLQRWQRAAQSRAGAADSRLEEFAWLLEELRVALFAQELRTPTPVSVKRLQKFWDAMQH